MRYVRTIKGRLELEIDDKPGPDSFVNTAEHICSGLGGTVVEKVNGFGESYWDIAIEGRTLTLHYHAYIGTRIYSSDPAAETTIRRVGDFLKEHLQSAEER